MGAGGSASGASVEAADALRNTSSEDINKALADLSPETREKLQTAMATPAPAALTSPFKPGQKVECRKDDGEAWCPGKVIALLPTEGRVIVMIKRQEDWMPHEFAQVRALEDEAAGSGPAADGEKIDSKAACGAKPMAAKFVATNAGMLTDNYDLDRKLGEGSYASVSRGKDKATSGVVAVKSIRKSQMKNMDRFIMEIDIHSSMDHPGIAKLYETFEDHRNLYLVMELLSGGELFDRIIECGHFTEKQAAIVMKQMLQAQNYIHEQGFCHRDLKPENYMFLTKEPIANSPIKLIDFGLACRCSRDQVLTTKAGTPYYVAPQVLAGKYDMKSDMWSLGVILYVLMCGYPPFYGETDAETLAKVRLGNYCFNAADWTNISEDCKNLIRMMLKMNPADRYTAEQALSHAWLSNMESEAEDSPLLGQDPAFLDRFRQFRSSSKFQKVARQAIAVRAGESQIKKLKERFLAMDKDGNGTLTFDELKEGMQKAGLGDLPEDLSDIFDSIGSEGLNKINYSEFLAATLDQRVYLAEDNLWSAFRMFDKNGDGKIDLDELKKMLSDGEEELVEEATKAAQDLITKADKNGDSVIDFDEFVVMMKE